MKNNENGFTLVEIMVSVGLLGALALSGAQMFKNQTQAQITVEKNYEVTTITNEIRNLLSNATNCQASLAGQNPSSGSVTKLRKEVNTVLTDSYQVNTQLPGNIRITSYQLVKTHPGLLTNETILQVKMSRGKAVLKDEAVRHIKISYKLSGANILTCIASSSGSDSLWEVSTVDVNDIHYPTGQVGIGTSDPQSALEVNGNILLNNSTIDSPSLVLWDASQGAGGKIWNIDSSNGRIRIFDEPIISTNPLSHGVGWERFVIMPNGNVGIGTSSPLAPFDIGATNNGYIRATSSDGGLEIASGNDATSYIDFKGSGNLTADYRGRFEYTDGVGLGIYTGGITPPKMHIHENGNVGVNIFPPQYMLDVNGPLRARKYIWQGGDNWEMPDSNAEMSFDFATGNGTSYLHVWDPTHGPILSVRNNGTVTIGDTSTAGGRNLTIGDDTFFTDIDVTNQLGLYGASDANQAHLKLGANGPLISGANQNLGVGTTNPQVKLDVIGEVKIGNTGAPCSGTIEGSQRYNATTKKMEFCNGTNWIAMGGGGTVVVHQVAFPGNGVGNWTTLGCYNACSLAHAHDCSGCGWDVADGGTGICPAGQLSWRGQSSRVGTSGSATCFRIE